MTKILGAMAMATFLAGCGGDDGGGGDVLANTQWQLDGTGNQCIGVIAYDGAHGFDDRTSCSLPDGSNQVLQQVGSYTVSANLLATTVSQSTCATATEHAPVYFTISRNTMTLQEGVTTWTLTRVTNSEVRARLVGPVGCFGSDGTFTPSPLAPI
jgi:hypothetical protein